MIKFLLDAGVPRSLQKLLHEKGHIAEHVFDLELGMKPDEAIYSYAVAKQSILIS